MTQDDMRRPERKSTQYRFHDLEEDSGVRPVRVQHGLTPTELVPLHLPNSRFPERDRHSAFRAEDHCALSTLAELFATQPEASDDNLLGGTRYGEVEDRVHARHDLTAV
ncbi:hypothetical protein ACH4PR_31460 [Streptomyces mirabilis]|uniref:hypothetical protein n=1 Tax=Streptomyces mirabilis TaxID=68239 RepID=UPI0037A17D78